VHISHQSRDIRPSLSWV